MELGNWNDLVIALITFIGVLFSGGVIVTLLKNRFQLRVHQNSSENEFRTELLARVDNLDKDLTAWKDKYFTILEELIIVKSTNLSLENKVKRLTNQLNSFKAVKEYEHFFHYVKSILPRKPTEKEALAFTYSTTDLIKSTTNKVEENDTD